MKDTRTPEQVQADNLDKVMERGPGLYADVSVYVVARDPDGYVLLGGLGAMGCGQMWEVEGGRHAHLPGYQDAPLEAVPPRTRKSFDRLEEIKEDLLAHLLYGAELRVITSPIDLDEENDS